MESHREIPQQITKYGIPISYNYYRIDQHFCKYFADQIAKLRSGLVSTEADSPVPGPLQK